MVDFLVTANALSNILFRRLAYGQDESLLVKYSGHTVTVHHSYPALLQRIQSIVEERLGEAFNHVMLNRYASGNEYIGKHRDTKENKVIVSLSLGAERTFIMTPNTRRTGVSPHRWILGNGSLVIMRGATQDLWKVKVLYPLQVIVVAEGLFL